MAYSAGFSPHPKISYVGAAPTGVASEAEYLEIGLARQVDPEQLRRALDEALPEGLDVLEAVVAGPGSLAERIQASHWRVELPGVSAGELRVAVAEFLSREELLVDRLTKDGKRSLDTRAAVLSASVDGPATEPGDLSSGGTGTEPGGRAILDMVVRQVTPSVRPDDVLAALRLVAGLAPAAPPVAVRVAQGPLDGSSTGAGSVGDPLAADRSPVRTPS